MTQERFTLTEAADLANCNRITVWRAVQSGRLPAELVRIAPFNQDVYYIERADLDKWIAARNAKKEGEQHAEAD